MKRAKGVAGFFQTSEEERGGNKKSTCCHSLERFGTLGRDSERTEEEEEGSDSTSVTGP